ncbi:MAG: hypothetical protein ACE5HS_23015, partial [bacterium]
PDFSPDGKKLALVRGEKIFVYNLETKEQTQLTFKGSNFFPSWSPDGKKIAYDSNSDNPGGTLSIWIMDADGENKKDLGAPELNPWRSPDWFPDFRIVHSRGTTIDNKGTNDLFVMDTTGTGVAQLTESIAMDQTPKVSPDGMSIIWQRWGDPDDYDSAVWLMNADGSDKVRLSDGYEPDWAPDGRHIIFRKRGEYVPGEPWDDDDPKGHGSLWIMKVETKEQWQFLPKN